MAYPGPGGGPQGNPFGAPPGGAMSNPFGAGAPPPGTFFFELMIFHDFKDKSLIFSSND